MGFKYIFVVVTLSLKYKTIGAKNNSSTGSSKNISGLVVAQKGK